VSIRRILIVGYGSIGQRHLRLVRESLPNADIRVLRHQVSDEIPEFANGCFSSLESAQAFRPELAVIANPAPFHLPVAQALIAEGCHLLIEKPLAADSVGVVACLELARAHGVVCQVGYNLRFLSSLQEFRRLVQAGLVGRVFSIRCEIGQYLPSWRPGTDYRQGVSARADLGGGVLLELSHEIDYLRWIFGEIRWVCAWTGRLGGLDLDVEDTAHLTLGFSADSYEAVGMLSMDFVRRDTTRQCLAIGTNGSLRWNALNGSVERYVPESAAWQEIFCYRHGRDDSYLAQWQHFMACVENSEKPCVTGEDGLAVVRIVEAAKRSASIYGQRVDVSVKEEC
jgi:predicted dehydrogenase